MHFNTAQKFQPGAFKVHNRSSLSESHKELTSTNLPTYIVRNPTSKAPGLHVFRDNFEVASTLSRSVAEGDIDILINGQTMPLTKSPWSGSQTIHHPTLGELQWKKNPLTGKAATLIDRNGTKLAFVKSSLMGRKFETCVPCDLYMLDLIVVSGMLVMIRIDTVTATTNAAHVAMHVAAAGAGA